MIPLVYLSWFKNKIHVLYAYFKIYFDNLSYSYKIILHTVHYSMYVDMPLVFIDYDKYNSWLRLKCYVPFEIVQFFIQQCNKWL